MAARIKLVAMLGVFTAVSLLWIALMLQLAVNPYKTKTIAAQGDQPAVKLVVPAYKMFTFWMPLLLVVFLAALLCVMLFVSSQKSGRWQGALIGTATALVAGILLLWLWPDRLEIFLFGRGVGFGIMVAGSMASYYLCARLARKWNFV